MINNKEKFQRTLEAYIEAARDRKDRWVYEVNGQYAIKEEQVNAPKYKLVKYIEAEFADNSPSMIAWFAATIA